MRYTVFIERHEQRAEKMKFERHTHFDRHVKQIVISQLADKKKNAK